MRSDFHNRIALMRRAHGAATRGSEFVTGSSAFEGRFGRMFRALPPAKYSNAALSDLAKAMTAAPEPQQTPEETWMQRRTLE
jgi:hypothetical protein